MCHLLLGIHHCTPQTNYLENGCSFPGKDLWHRLVGLSVTYNSSMAEYLKRKFGKGVAVHLEEGIYWPAEVYLGT